MRLVEFWEDASRHTGVLTESGQVLDLSWLGLADVRGAWGIAADGARRQAVAVLAAHPPSAGLREAGALRWAPPIRPGKILGVGLNYLRHAEATPLGRPDHPVWFMRGPHTLVAHGEPLTEPANSQQLDWEGEVAVVVGAEAYRVRAEDVEQYVVGYTLFNDASVRDYQFRGPQWTLGKNFPGTGACGPWLLTADAMPAEGIALTTWVNGEKVQAGHTRDLLFGVADLLADVSAVMPLAPGDVILTGTPGGVGFTRQPPRFLRPGDICQVDGGGLGILRNPVCKAGEG
ncbi:MAG: fumarylacetoacetate hydrolase family protein [Thermaerobacter sp.]|nr:fumarylacetoacetate hydrolase family protein [Thermaerobacter sp.]